MNHPARIIGPLSRVAMCILAIVSAMAASRAGLAQAFEAGQGEMSTDGSTVFYQTKSSDLNSDLPFSICRWTAATGGVPIAKVPSGTYLYWDFINSNGSVAVATVEGWNQQTSSYTVNAWRWTSAGLNANIGLLGYARNRIQATSADGTVLLGTSENENRSRVFRWVATTGSNGTATELGLLTGDTDADAYSGAMSSDGTVIVGRSWNSASLDQHLFRWQKSATSNSGALTKIADLPDHSSMQAAYAEIKYINANGSTIIGNNRDWTGGGKNTAWRWTSVGTAPVLGVSGFSSHKIEAVSADGTVAAGSSYSGDSWEYNYTSRAFRWVAGAGTSGASTDLGVLPGDTDADCDYYGGAMSSDGTIVIGRSWNRNTGAMHLFRWQKHATGNAGTMTKLADLPTSTPADAQSYTIYTEVQYINANGSTIIGSNFDWTDGRKTTAWRWTLAGTVPILGVAGYQNHSIQVISPDGTVAAGSSSSGNSWESNYTSRAFRWVAGTGTTSTTTDLGKLPGDTDAELDYYGGGVGANGSVILGRSWNRNLADAPKHLFRWQKNSTGNGGVMTGITRAPATITQITPGSGPLAGGTTITITGTNLIDTSSVRINGVAATDLRVISNTSLTAVTPPGSVGLRDVSLTTPGGTVTKTSSFTYVALPTIATVSPAAGPLTGGTTVTIAGTNLSGATVKIGGVAATVSAVTATSITAKTPVGSVGAKDLAITTVGGTATKTSAFTYVALPTIATVLPSSGPLVGGTTITIAGTNLSGATVKIGGVAATVSAVTATSITAKTPVGSVGAKDVSVTTVGGTATKTSAFTYVALPTIATVSPSSGPLVGGTTISIAGTNLSGATVKIGGVAATVSAVTATSITAKTPVGSVGTKDVSVTTVGGTVTKTSAFTYVALPTIATVMPSSGPLLGGTTISIAGTNLSGATVKVGGVAATVSAVTATSITAKTPVGSVGAKDVSVTTVGGTATKASAFTYVAVPTLATVTPSSGPLVGGTTITIAGTNLTGATVKIGGVAATVSASTATSVTAKTPAGSVGAKDVTVTTVGGTATKASAFTYVALPTIASVSPVAGPLTGGTTITIAGTNLSGATVKIGGAAATVSASTATSVTAKTPAGSAGAKDLAITTVGGTATKTSAFTYQPTPTIASITPALGSTAGSTPIVIFGTGFVPGATILKIGGVVAQNVVAVSTTRIEARTPAATAGLADVQVTTTGGIGTKSGAFNFVAQPTITAISPSSGPIVGGTNITINGSSFSTVSAVLIGSIPVTLFTIDSPTKITAVTPAGSPGAKTVTVTNAAGSTTRSNGFTYTATFTGGMPTGNGTSPSSKQGSAEVASTGGSQTRPPDAPKPPANVHEYLRLITIRVDSPCDCSMRTPYATTESTVASEVGDGAAAETLSEQDAEDGDTPDAIDLDANGEPDICQLRRGDLNLDSSITELDLPLLIDLLHTTPLQGIGDLDASGEIDYADLAVLLVAMEVGDTM